MKEFKRYSTVAILVAMLSMLVCPVTASEIPFTDIGGSEYYDAIKYVYNEGIMNGMTETTFEPDVTITRGMIVTILYRMSGSTLKIAPDKFDDVEEGRYYYYAVGWAQSNGIAEGMSSTKFAPNLEVSREQALTFLWRYAVNYKWWSYEIPNLYEINSAYDYGDVGDFSKEAVNWAVNCGIASKTDNYIKPDEGLSRGLCADYLHKMLTLAFGDAKVLTIPQFAEYEVGPAVCNYLIDRDYDATERLWVNALATRFAFYNSDVIYVSCHGKESYIFTDSDNLYDFQIADDSMTHVDLAYISACLAGQTFCKYLSEYGGAKSVVGFTEEISYDWKYGTGGSEKFDLVFFYYYSQGYSAEYCKNKALEQMSDYDKTELALGSVVVY